MATYDPAWCDEFINEVSALHDIAFGVFWHMVVLGAPCAPYSDRVWSLFCRYVESPIWCRQAVLYRLEPLVAAVTVRAARAESARARLVDPL